MKNQESQGNKFQSEGKNQLALSLLFTVATETSK
jgi:hypothetical protein